FQDETGPSAFRPHNLFSTRRDQTSQPRRKHEATPFAATAGTKNEPFVWVARYTMPPHSRGRRTYPVTRVGTTRTIQSTLSCVSGPRCLRAGGNCHTCSRVGAGRRGYLRR